MSPGTNENATIIASVIDIIFFISSYRLIEVKGDNKIDDEIVKAKATAADEMAVASGVEYIMYAGSQIINSHILDEDQTQFTHKPSLLDYAKEGMKVAEDNSKYDNK